MRRGVGLCLFVLATSVLLAGANAQADARSDYLINMLENGGSYRVRVQAASTLGKIRCQEAVPSLVKALDDENELVVISSANALGQIGDVSVIDDVQRAGQTTESEAARSQLKTTLRVLRALNGEAGLEEAKEATPEFLIRVDVMGNSSGVNREGITDTFRDIVVDRLRREPGVVLQKKGVKRKQVLKRLKKENLRGYVISGSIIRLEHEDDKMVVKISLNVFTNPDYTLLIMPSAQGAVQVSQGTLSEEVEIEAQDTALKAVVDSLIEGVFKALRDMDAD